MTDLLIIVPSRGRPRNVAALERAFQDTARGSTDLLFGFDDDDPELEGNEDAAGNSSVGPRLRMVGTLNMLALEAADEYDAIGFLGDDHAPRTVGFDARVMATLEKLGTGITYGNDLFQGENLPTAVFMTSDIIKALGYMAPPVLQHMWADNVWKAWGEAMGKLTYLPDVVIEHMHPQADGKAPMDDRYAEVWPLMDSDKVQYDLYRSDGFNRDVEKLKALL